MSYSILFTKESKIICLVEIKGLNNYGTQYQKLPLRKSSNVKQISLENNFIQQLIQLQLNQQENDITIYFLNSQTMCSIGTHNSTNMNGQKMLLTNRNGSCAQLILDQLFLHPVLLIMIESNLLNGIMNEIGSFSQNQNFTKFIRR